MLCQGVSYAVPAWILGLLTAQFLMLGVNSYFVSKTSVGFSTSLSFRGIITATLLGIVMPLISSIVPIKEALSANIHDSIDTRRSKTKVVTYQLERSKDESLPTSFLVFGASLLIFGFLIYYLLPLSLLSMNFSLLLEVFVGILLGMLFGMVMLSLNVERLFQNAIIYVLFFWEKSVIISLVSKNLVAHVMRNRKTSLMYALSLSFLLYLSVSYNTQINSVTFAVEKKGLLLFFFLILFSIFIFYHISIFFLFIFFY